MALYAAHKNEKRNKKEPRLSNSLSCYHNSNATNNQPHFIKSTWRGKAWNLFCYFDFRQLFCPFLNAWGRKLRKQKYCGGTKRQKGTT